MADECGLDIGVVLDLSNSLTDGDVADSKSAAKAVASGLTGTPSTVSVNTFATFGPDGTNEPIPSTSVATDGSVDSLNAQIDALQRVPENSGGTNWDRGLAQLDGSNHDLVLFVTDGKPTAYGVPGSEAGNTDRGTRTDQIDIDKAVESSNSLKSEGTRVVGLGVGDEINEDNIKLVSGQTAGDDYYVVSDYDQLAEQLRAIATKSCRGTLNVTKLIDPDVGEHAETADNYPGAGWTITSPDSVDGTEKVTNADGTVSFKLKTPADGVQASEVQQDGYRLQQQSGANAVCTSDGQDVATENISDGFELTEIVGVDEIITCQIINEQIPGALSWNKVDTDGRDLAGAEFTVTGPDGDDFVVSDNGELDADKADGQFEVTDLAWGDYTIRETSAPEGYELTEETQTVTITGEKREVSFSDIVNEKDDTVGPDPDGDSDASSDPDGDSDASSDPDGEANASSDPGADSDESSDPNGDDSASKDPDGSATTDPEGSATADPEGSATADPDGDVDTSTDPDAAVNASTDPDGSQDASADPAGSEDASADPAGSEDASADPDGDQDASSVPDADQDASSASTADENASSDASPDSSSDAGASVDDDGFSADSTSASNAAADGGNGGDHLPRTGAAGAVTFGILGLLLVVGGAVAVIMSKRRKTRR